MFLRRLLYDNLTDRSVALSIGELDDVHALLQAVDACTTEIVNLCSNDSAHCIVSVHTLDANRINCAEIAQCPVVEDHPVVADILILSQADGQFATLDLRR